MDWLLSYCNNRNSEWLKDRKTWSSRNNTSVLKCQTVHRTPSNIIPNRMACLEKSVTTMSPPLWSYGKIKNKQINHEANELVFTSVLKSQIQLIWSCLETWIKHGTTSGVMGGLNMVLCFEVSTHAHSVIMVWQDAQQPGFRKHSDVLQLLQMLPWDINTHKQHNSNIVFGSKLKVAALPTWAYFISCVQAAQLFQ